MDIRIDIKKILLSITSFLAISNFSTEPFSTSSIIDQIINIVGNIEIKEKDAIERLKKVLESEFNKNFDYLEPDQCQEIINECFSAKNIEDYLLGDEIRKFAAYLKDSILKKVTKFPEKYDVEYIKNDVNYEDIANNIIRCLKNVMAEDEVLRKFEHRMISSHTMSLVSCTNSMLGQVLEMISQPNSAYLWNSPKHGNRCSDILRFHYSNVDVDFYDRIHYLDMLKTFCGYDVDMKLLTYSPEFLWWIITGKGGVGKSRLAFEFSKEMENIGWTVCYPYNNQKETLYRCSENLPNNTLFILDYTESDYSDIGEWLVSFSTNKYKNVKVRVLLIQRFLGKIEWLLSNQSLSERNVIRSFAYQNGESLEIDTISDESIKQLMFKFADGKIDSNEIDGLFDILCKIDTLKRPLFALAVADAYANGIEISKEYELLDYLCEKEIESIRGRINRLFKDNVYELCNIAKNIYIMATMVGEFSLTSQLSMLLPDDYTYLSNLYYENQNKFYLETMLFDSVGKDVFCKPIEPDIIGEAFVLNYIKRNKKLLQNAWNKPYTMSRFVTRLHQDFEDRLWEIDEYIDSPILPENCTEISQGTFFNCTYLHSITLPDKVNIIGTSAFSQCTNLSNVHIPQDIKEIGDFAFRNCKNLVKVELPEGLRSIGNLAFCGCSNLIEINLPDSLIFLGDMAFGDCKKLTSIKIPEGITNVYSRTFKGCDELEDIDLPLNITTILNFMLKSDDEAEGQAEYWDEAWAEELLQEPEEELPEEQSDKWRE